VIGSRHLTDVPDHIVAVRRPRERPTFQRIAKCYGSGCRLNDITKPITSWASITAAPILIIGFHGQNVPYPGAAHPFGFWISTLLIVCGTLLLHTIFTKKGRR
jgi:Mg2+ and Co2+ transporter CorA